MESPNVKINSLVGLINYRNPKFLKGLKEKFPEYTKQLTPGTVLGSGADHKVLILLSIEGLEQVLNEVDPSIRKLHQRLSRAKNIKLGGQIVAALTSAGLVGAVLGDWEKMLILTTACINFVSVILAMIGTHLETPLYGGNESLVKVFENVIKYESEAKQLLQELKIMQESGEPDMNKVSEIAQKSNMIAGKINQIIRQLNL